MKIAIALFVIGALGVGYVAFDMFMATSESGAISDHRNTEYVLEGERVQLQNGYAETAAAPGSAAKVITRYLGHELETDLDGDGRTDIAFILTQERGGSGTFFYAVAARDTGTGYVGSDGFLLGDRIVPQSTEISSNPRHRNVIVFNYLDRASGDPLAAKPTLSKSAYLKLDSVDMRWGIVEANFEGESR